MPDRRNRGLGRLHRSDLSKLDDSGTTMDDELLFRSVAARTAPVEQARVVEWLAASERNASQLEDLVDVLLLTAAADDELDFGRAPSGEEILDSSRETSAAARGHGRTWRVALLAAAMLAGLALAVPVAQRLLNRNAIGPAAGFGPDEFTTEAEPATVGLRDGTVIRLAPATRLRLYERRNAREVSLAGRGYFAVAPDSEAPFTVRSDAGTVTVLGTRFDLTASDDDLHLIVIEGRVRLTVRGATVEVHAGQLARVLKGNLVPPIEVPDPESLVGWVGDFIVFQDTPLRIVAHEIERRHGIRIELSDPETGDRTVTALFAGRTLDEITEVVCVVAQLRCTTAGDVLRMAPAR